jgi:Tol biopolymer transport system component
LLGTLPIPKGSGSSVPETANLSWSQDGTKLIFEFGRNAANRAVFLAYADGSGLVKIVDSAYAPTVSADGNCLAYISSRQVFIIDLAATSSTPLLVADFPTKGTGDFRLDKLQWSP